MYTYDKKVLFSNLDEDSNMSLVALVGAMQDCVNINSESIGKGISYMQSTGRAWFAIGWNIHIKRMPHVFEDVVVKTWPYGFSSSMGFRNVIITDSNGEDIVCADSIWSLVNKEEGRPIKIEAQDYEGYDIEPEYPLEKSSRKIKFPKEMERVGEYTVRKSDIDFNRHMSNAKYIEHAFEYVPFDKKIKQIRVEYKQQSRYGEVLDMDMSVESCENTEDTKYIIKITGQENNDIKAVVEFVTEQK